MPITATFLEQGGQQPSEVATLLAAFFRAARSTLHLAIYDFRLSDSLAAPVVDALRDRVSAGVEVRIAYDAGKPLVPFQQASADPAPPGTARFVSQLGSGILAKGTRTYARYAYQEAEGDLLERARQLEAICDRYGVPLAAAALQFSLRDPRIVSSIVGISRPERLQQTIALAEHPIPDDLWAELASVPPTTEDPEAHRFT